MTIRETHTTPFSRGTEENDEDVETTDNRSGALLSNQQLFKKFDYPKSTIVVVFLGICLRNENRNQLFITTNYLQ